MYFYIRWKFYNENEWRALDISSFFLQVRSLDGLWDFVVSPKGDALKGYTEGWFTDDFSKVSVT